MRTLAEAYRRFAEQQADGGSPLSGRVAAALSGSEAAMRAVGALPARRRQPAVVLAALHDLALGGTAPALAAALAEGDGDAAARAGVDALVGMAGAVAALVARRLPQTVDTARCAVLHPAVAEAARRLGAASVGLVDVGGAPGLNLQLDRVAIRYGDGPAVGDPSSAVQIAATVVGDRPVPTGPLPHLVARIAVGPHPVDVTDPDDVRWLRACVPPDHAERAARLAAELALAASAPPVIVRGEVDDVLPEAVARVPAGALPVVTTTWALSALPREGRQRFLRRLEEVAAERPVAWVSAEGVGVAPSVPTLGDRPASGHSIVGLALLGGPAPRIEVLGRCWSRGRLLSWLAGS
ncbi:DUF2332 domain-containing protein [Blastococcus litoris]|uniref:DUF2332 domain-containing protein n=1 Tax=Blastococcus litoris TaxID=2171622 RepID=UPI0019D2877C|nr:DUF2332 domain-containing protein [Blastococcus litoris]